MAQNFYIDQAELDTDQMKLLQMQLGNLVVEGCAGSGKSILALWKAKQIQDTNAGSYKIIVFTKALYKYMLAGVKECGLNINNVLYHWEWEKRYNKESADYLIVDEVQDFTPSDVDDFVSHANKAVIFFGDTAQSIYQGLPNRQAPVPDMKFVADKVNVASQYLQTNHRLPKTIARIAQNVSSQPDSRFVDRCKKEGTEKPHKVQCDSFEEQMDKIISVIQNRDLDDVGILLPSNPDAKRAYEYLSAKGIASEVRYRAEGGDFMNLDFNSTNPKIMTYHSAKGMQFETVFLPNCEISGNNYRNPLYVAMTRSTDKLYVLYTNTLSNFLDHPVSLNYWAE